MRIAVGGFLHESHSFAPRPTTYQDFVNPGGFPPLRDGPAMLDAIRGASCGLAGVIAAAETAGHTLVPLAWGFANPAGPVQDEAFERIAATIGARLSAALAEASLDGIYLDLHGAAMVDSFPDAEAELLRRVRAIAGPIPLTTSLDPHANMTRAMVDRADSLSPYLTYPHVDMPDAGARAFALLLRRIEHARPFARAYRPIDFLIRITAQCTLLAPMADLMAARTQILADTGALELAWCFAFPYCDFDGCGPAIAAYATDQATADAAADRFAAEINRREADFTFPLLDPADAVRTALDHSHVEVGPGGPVIIADTQDNPGGGGHGDTTALLAELIAQRAAGAVLCLINDAESAAACHAAGEGASLRLSLGGKSDGAPLPIEATVRRLTDGRFTLTGPMGRGNPGNLGPCALIEVAPPGAPTGELGVRVLVVSRKMQALDQAILRHAGVEPAETPILVLKSSVHFRADFAPIAREIIVAAAPGPVVADPAILPFRHLRPGLRTRPGANR